MQNSEDKGRNCLDRYCTDLTIENDRYQPEKILNPRWRLGSLHGLMEWLEQTLKSIKH